MLPLLQSEEIKHSIVEYLKATFNFEDKEVDQAFSDCLLHPKRGMFKGPYMQMRLPFESVKDEADKKELDQTLVVKPPFDPYVHQFESFKRLSTRNGHEPKPVILTTGTGSGKTESFLFPLLDYCLQQSEKKNKGIKAIILYPMNALATDQARRLAKEIHNFEDADGNFPLRDKIRAGLFIGEGKESNGVPRSTRMSETQIIEDRDTLVKSPPDILLTNFKMLDFSLLQARFHDLWKHNFEQPDLLKFLVLDELHTYDGAKGSDVANLIRRLKLKLNLTPNQIVPVGTSATMSGGEDGKRELVSFFSQVFGVEVDSDAVIGESRLNSEDFFDDELEQPEVDLSAFEKAKFLEGDNYETYIKRQISLWGYSQDISPSELGLRLKANTWLYELSEITGNAVVDINNVKSNWSRKLGLNEEQSDAFFGSLLALVSYAKEEKGKLLFPFLYLQITYWMRSLNRMVRRLQQTPVFEWESDLNPADETKSLPPYYCRECGGSGWLGIKKEHNSSFEEDLSVTRSSFIADKQNKNVFFVSDVSTKKPEDLIASDYEPTGDIIDGYVQSNELSIYEEKENEDQFKILGVRSLNGDHIEKTCPHCNAKNNTLALIGTGVPTIESIATAQVLATATDPSLDKERKLLAFTNGVQDAAHQAGFIENRNYRFGMRHAIQTVLNSEEELVGLDDFYNDFDEYWKNNADDSENHDVDAYYYKFLPPDCESRLSIESFRNTKGDLSISFSKEFKNRLSWEVWKEFSFRAQVGRTLEKSGASAVAFDQEQMEEVFDQMKWWLQSNSLGERVAKGDFLKFLNGFLHRLRNKGGVDHPYLKKYRTERTNYYLITQNVNKKFFMIENFGKRSRLPKFITLTSGNNTKAFDVIQAKGKHNWFTTYFRKCFSMVHKSEIDLINEFYEQLVEYLDSNGLLDKKVASGVTNYGIPQNVIQLSNQVETHTCDTCGHTLNTAQANGGLVNDMPCLQNRCSGHYKKTDNSVFDYYRMVYNRGRTLRIFAKDHTGLIDRDKREKIENDFKNQPDFDSTNVLVATSTLEMGIDIGDLNVTFNSSLPPETSNYLQRVGRAGRSSGTSLILNVAGRDAHDLYYFQDPEEMMSGEVRTPACYLEARDILKRHFIAFCFDSWASKDPDHNNIPMTVNDLKLKSHPIGDESFVFNVIANFVKGSKQSLLKSFKLQYGNVVDGVSFQDLSDALVSNRLSQELENIHPNLLKEINYYSEKRKAIDRELNKLPETGDEVLNLKNEKKALGAAIRNINERNVIEHLTNEGILPNYAFPETGVLLNAQIRSKKDEEGVSIYDYQPFGDIVRASSTALSELAPANIFYSQGQMLESQGLEVRSDDDYEEYRFCSNCDHMTLNVNVGKDELFCPSCGDPSWSAESNKKTIVRLKAVTSVNDKEGSRITDSSDDRERKFYNKSVHIKVDHKTSEGAHVLKRVPFGIEFFHNVSYTQLNTGIQEEGFYGNKTLEINGDDQPEVGFVVCKTCGKATEKTLTDYELNNKKRSYHFAYCSNKNEDYKDKSDSVFEEIYLYRQFNTEALLVLLPVQDFRTQEKIALFKAGLYLGLRDYYKGKPDHIIIQETSIFNKETQRMERYLVLYETIPGGTGYLSQLFDTTEFTNVIRASYERLAYCSCKKEGKDGCYRCIYTYGNQFERDILSRSDAEELFKDLLDKSDEWNALDSLQHVKGFANNEESDLERKFVEALDVILNKKPGCYFKTDNSKGLKKYKVQFSEGNNTVLYELWPQNLSQFLQGISEKTKPDFLFKCIGLIINGENADIDEVESVKSIAVFLDGYQFHASADHPRFYTDIIKRNAILDSEEYLQWTLTWDDFTDEMDHIGECFSEGGFNKIGPKHPQLRNHLLRDFEHRNNLSRFIKLLKSPIDNLSNELWSGYLIFNLKSKFMDTSRLVDENKVNELVNSYDPEIKSFDARNPSSFAVVDKADLNEETPITAFVSLSDFSVKGFQTIKLKEGWEKSNWSKFWDLYNLTQFHHLKPIEQSLATPEEVGQDDSTEILENFSEELHEIVRSLIEKNIQFNEEYDFDLIENELIIASAELGSEENKFVVNVFESEEIPLFERKGYSVFTASTFDIDKVL